MQKISLNSQQKDDLVEMCEFLFPEYNIDIHDKISKHINLDDSFIDWSKEIIENEGTEEEAILYEDSSIHWFEFCITHLLYKLSYFLQVENKLVNNLASEFYNNNTLIVKGDNNYIHPVDFLYEKFKLV